MVISFDIALSSAVENIGPHKKRIISVTKCLGCSDNSRDDNINLWQAPKHTGHPNLLPEHQKPSERYRKAKQIISQLINENYGPWLIRPVDPYNWLFKREDDEISYFICEMGANAINYSGAGWPESVEAFLGRDGFIIGVVWGGAGFDAATINRQKSYTHQGDGFRFLRKCSGTVFFDDPGNAHAVFYTINMLAAAAHHISVVETELYTRRKTDKGTPTP